MEETFCNKCAKGEKDSPSCGLYGEGVACAAIDAMEAEEKQANAISADAETFIDACEKKGRNPIEVVKFVAGKNGISLSGSRPDDAAKASLYDLLREVVDTVVESFFDMEDGADGADEDEGDEEDDEAEDGSYVCDNCNHAVLPRSPVLTRRPVRRTTVVGYAFSW